MSLNNRRCQLPATSVKSKKRWLAEMEEACSLDHGVIDITSDTDPSVSVSDSDMW